MRRGLIVLIVLLLAMVGVVSAQDEDNLCDGDNLSAVADMLEGAAAAIREGSEDLPILLQALQLMVSYTIADCNGLTFSSEIEGLQPTMGPFMIEEGIYIARATTTGFFIAEFTVLDGACGEGDRMGDSIFILNQGEADSGAEVVVQSEGCEVLMSIGTATEDWTIEFEKIR